MNEPYKVEEVYKYTETVYYSADDVEVHRERNHDDWWYGSGEEMPVSEEEIEAYYDEGSN